MKLGPRHAESTALLKVAIVCGLSWCWTEKAEEVRARKAHGSTDSPLTRTGGSLLYIGPYLQAFPIPRFFSIFADKHYLQRQRE